MSVAAPLICLHDASVQFANVKALDSVSLTVHAGEVLAVVGANGSGKTTLLRVLHGQVRHHGERRVARDALRQAMVFQRPFVMRLSARANIELALWLAGAPRAQRREQAARALARVGLGELHARPARALSLGQQQRLALARAWASDPDLLFLDEPTASLDPSAKKEVESLLAGFASDGMTLVISTHNLGQAKRLATRVVYLEAGRIVVDLPTQEFFSDRLDGRVNRFVKGDTAWEL